MIESSIGRKAIVAVTGLGLFAFVIGHMLGNLQIFMGPDVLNGYAHKLKATPALLWTVRLGLLAFFVAHMAVALRLAWENRQARPIPYSFEDTVKASRESRTMVRTGLIVLAFVIYHLLHFTVLVTNPEYAEMRATLPGGTEVPDVYAMVVAGFSNVFVAAIYIVAQVLLAMHLCHGASSLFQTIGLNSSKYRPIIGKIGPVGATIIAVGNISIPLAVLAGFLHATPGGM